MATRVFPSNAISFKQWVFAEALREGVKPILIYKRRLAGWYPALSIIVVNQRVMFVERDETPRRERLRDWVKRQAQRDGVTASAIYNRLGRGKYPRLALERINRSVVFVEEA
jgi:hypothetical protein